MTLGDWISPGYETLPYITQKYERKACKKTPGGDQEEEGAVGWQHDTVRTYHSGMIQDMHASNVQELVLLLYFFRPSSYLPSPPLTSSVGRVRFHAATFMSDRWTFSWHASSRSPPLSSSWVQTADGIVSFGRSDERGSCRRRTLFRPQTVLLRCCRRRGR